MTCKLCDYHNERRRRAFAAADGQPRGHPAYARALQVDREHYDHLVTAHGYPLPAVEQERDGYLTIQTLSGTRRVRVSQPELMTA